MLSLSSLHHFVALGAGGGIDHDASLDRIDPHAGVAPDGKGAGQQFVGDGVLELAHFAAARLVTLLFLDFLGARLGHLVDDGGRQQLLFGAQRDQHLAADRVHQRAVVARRHPAQTLHLDAAAWLERLAGELFVELFRGERERRGEAVDLQILEPHDVSVPEKSARVYMSRGGRRALPRVPPHVNLDAGRRSLHTSGLSRTAASAIAFHPFR